MAKQHEKCAHRTDSPSTSRQQLHALPLQCTGKLDKQHELQKLVMPKVSKRTDVRSRFSTECVVSTHIEARNLATQVETENTS